MGAGDLATVPLILEGALRRLNVSTTTIIKPHDLTVEQWRVLDCVARGDEMTMTELARTVLVPTPTVTRIVDKLVSMALVYRSSGMNDRRHVLVHASTRGLRLHTRLAPQIRQAQASIFEGVTQKQQEQLLLLLRLLGQPSG